MENWYRACDCHFLFDIDAFRNQQWFTRCICKTRTLHTVWLKFCRYAKLNGEIKGGRQVSFFSCQILHSWRWDRARNREKALQAVQPDCTVLQAENYSFPRFVCVRDLFMCRRKQEVGCHVLLTAASATRRRTLSWWYLACRHQLDRIGTTVSSSAKASSSTSQVLSLFAHFIICTSPSGCGSSCWKLRFVPTRVGLFGILFSLVVQRMFPRACQLQVIITNGE